MDNGNMQENGGAGSSSGEGTGFTQPNADNNAFVTPGEQDGFTSGNAEHSAFIQPGEDTGDSQQSTQGEFSGTGGNVQGGFVGTGGDGFTQGGFNQAGGNGFTQGGTQGGFAGNDGNGFTQGGNTQGGFTGNGGNGFTQPNGGYSQPVQNNYSQSTGSIADSNAFSIAGMVLGILSIVCCCCDYIPIIVAIIGLAFSIIALVKKSPGRGMAIAGVVCGSIGLLMGLGLLILGKMLPTDTQQLRQWQNYLEQYQDDF